MGKVDETSDGLINCRCDDGKKKANISMDNFLNVEGIIQLELGIPTFSNLYNYNKFLKGTMASRKPNAFGLAVGASVSAEYLKFAACFEPLCVNTPEGRNMLLV